MLPRTRFEHRAEKIASSSIFAWRLARVAAFWLVLTGGGLVIGMIGYALTESMNVIDSFLNAAMILSGMGPAAEVKTTGGKIFAGFYAIFSGLMVVVATGFVLAPILHRVLHAFHVESETDKGE
jgi:hypothetical protein